MDNTLHRLQPNADAVLMCAAVADLRRASVVEVQKLPKDRLIASLEKGWELVPDLLAGLVRHRVEGQALLGFAALAGTDEQLLELGRRKHHAKGCDLLMVNPIDRPGQGLDSALNGGWLLGPGDRQQLCPVEDKLVLSHRLLDRLLELKLPA
jgi:phosphopantothenoylcysteine decarboxylase/phosphopantothenate--cysteine ligase